MINEKDKEYLNYQLKADCSKCFGFCCVALYFSKSEGFPVDKEAGKPCINLQDDFKCSVHKKLKQNGLKGCIAYDCFGAGQKVAQTIYKGQNWRQDKKTAEEMFEVFLVIRQLHEMLWYLTEAFRLNSDKEAKNKIGLLINETQQLTNLDANSILKLDIGEFRKRVNMLLFKTSQDIRKDASIGQKNRLKRKKTIAGRINLIGANLQKINLVGEDLSGALLIAANLRENDLSCTDLIGADFRDADIRGADFTNSIFITQAQINAAIGNSDTKLSTTLDRPTHWEK
jgi:uncharacterized protein YjbI with pentapeptide repeats